MLLLPPENRTLCNKLLPEDCHYQPKNLVKLFLRANVTITLVTLTILMKPVNKVKILELCQLGMVIVDFLGLFVMAMHLVMLGSQVQLSFNLARYRSNNTGSGYRGKPKKKKKKDAYWSVGTNIGQLKQWVKRR